jgi:hypothetical protein
MNDRRQPHADRPEDAARGGSPRYGQAKGAKGSGHQESKKSERKEERGFVSRQGGDQSRPEAGR